MNNYVIISKNQNFSERVENIKTAIAGREITIWDI